MSANILKWFSGKALEGAREALDLLAKSAEAGEWVPGASRRVRATLSKPTVAKKWAKANEGLLRGIKLPHQGDYSNAGFDILMVMSYGQVDHVRKLSGTILSVLAQAQLTDEQRAAVLKAQEFCDDFYGIALDMAKYDSTRPKPVFTQLGVSPTITKTLTDAGLDLVPSTARLCPIEWYQEPTTGKDGETVLVWKARLVWPEGTVFGASRHARHGRGEHRPCHACGHGIRNPYNWVPVLIDDKDGVPHALFTGRDCAGSVFGIGSKGEIHLEEGSIK
jgi:hypothetical protein